MVHYCVTNMLAVCARTSTQALTNATLPYVLRLAGLGWRQALRDDAGLCNGLNLCLGKVTHAKVAEDLGYGFVRWGKFWRSLAMISRPYIPPIGDPRFRFASPTLRDWMNNQSVTI